MITHDDLDHFGFADMQCGLAEGAAHAAGVILGANRDMAIAISEATHDVAKAAFDQGLHNFQDALAALCAQEAFKLMPVQIQRAASPELVARRASNM